MHLDIMGEKTVVPLSYELNDCRLCQNQSINKVGRHKVSFHEVVSLSLRESMPTVVLALRDLAILVTTSLL